PERPRLLAHRRWQDVEVGRQRGGSAGAGRQVRQRRVPLLHHARDGVRPRRRLPRGSAGRAPQCRSRQRPRQPRVTRFDADRQLRRRRGAGGRRVARGSRGRRRLRARGEGRRGGDGRARVPPGAGRDLGVRRRRQPLRRRQRAVGAEEGPGEAAAPERRALYARGVAALPRRRAGAVRARRGGEDPLGARPDGRADARRRGLGPAPGRRACPEDHRALPARGGQEAGAGARGDRRRRRTDQHRRVPEDRPARGAGAGRRGGAEVEEAAEAARVARHRGAHGARRHRRALRTRRPRGPPRAAGVILAFAQTWGVSTASFVGGLLTLFVFRRGLPHVGLIVGYLLLLWLLVAVLVQVRDTLVVSERRAHRLVLTATEYVVQTLYH